MTGSDNGLQAGCRDPQIHAGGGLAAILELAVSGQQKTAIQTDSGVCIFQVLVAGARNRRYLHLDFASV